MRPNDGEHPGYKQDQILIQLAAFDREAWLLFLVSVCAVAILMATAAIGLEWLSGSAAKHVLVASGLAAILVIFCAEGIKRAMNAKLSRIRGVYSLARRRNDTDALTGALIRNRFLDNLSAALANRRNTGGAVAMIVIDIDHFKQINDSFGHPTGDAVLKFCVNLAASTFHKAIVGRMGGDEFALFIEYGEPIEPAYLESACAEFLVALRKGLQCGHRRQAVSASMGIALAPTDAERADILFSHADMALYEAKKKGRGTWSFFHHDLLADKRHERFIERELRAAILMQELNVLYQPIVTADGKLTSLEALVRWQHPVRGRISPAEFIPVAERSRLIHDLGLAVLRRICRDLSELPNVPVNINVSARQLVLDHFQSDFLGVLDEYGIDPSRIVIEITESSFLQVSDSVLERIVGLKKAGFRIALDDFGMGYSEFNQLRTLPFDIIKIDKSYIQNLGSDNVTDVFVSAVVAIARHLDRDVVAEGIEKDDDIRRALAAGCRHFQGFLFEKPVELKALTDKYGDIRGKAA